MAKSRKYEPLENGGEGGGDDGYTAAMRLQAAERLERRAKRFMYVAVGLLVLSLFALMGAAVVRRPSMLECDQMVSPWCAFDLVSQDKAIERKSSLIGVYFCSFAMASCRAH